MTNRALLLSTLSPCMIAALVAAGCSGGSSSKISPASTGAGGSIDSGGSSSEDAAGGTVGPPGTRGSGPDGEATTSTDSSAPGSSTDATSPPSDSGPADSAIPGWTLTWSDEFNGPDGSAVDPTKWTHDVGGTGWGNDELEYYTDGSQNAVVQGGYLVITATTQGASQYSCSYGTCKYTSARLKTQGLFAQEYGRFEARAQMPTGQGLWPAIWALGDNINTVSWPACGEIDFMETIGSDITTNHGSLHMPNGYGPTGTVTLPNGASFADAFHTFAVEWEPGTVSFLVDEQVYETQTQASVPAGDTWEFNHPFFLLINVAVGGQWPGSPNSTTTFPQTLKVDWIRAYQKTGTEP